MSVAKSKKSNPSGSRELAVASVLARVQRRGGSSRVGRRSALLGVLTSMYANTSRGHGPNRPSNGTGSVRTEQP